MAFFAWSDPGVSTSMSSASVVLPLSSVNSIHLFEKFVCIPSNAFFESLASASAVDHSFFIKVVLSSNSSSFLVVVANLVVSSKYKSDRFISSLVGISDVTLSSFSTKVLIRFNCSSFSDMSFLICLFLDEANTFKSANWFFSCSTSFDEVDDFPSSFSSLSLPFPCEADDGGSCDSVALTSATVVLPSNQGAADSLSSSAFATAFSTSFSFTRPDANL
mmetsp:Transcript_61831/g.126084  ORF Transcript_61831/g.126084 Transcript_61831/m.126084 type:complete len:219 (+) Transcript_61831:1142-1798(+)